MADSAANFTRVARSRELYPWAKPLIPGTTELFSGRRILPAAGETHESVSIDSSAARSGRLRCRLCMRSTRG